MPAFQTTANGIYLTFENGVTVSIAYNRERNYCDENTYETMVWDSNDRTIPIRGQDVQGWQTPLDVLVTLAYAASLDKVESEIQCNSSKQ